MIGNSKLWAASLVGVATLLTSAPASAHHSFAMFDMSKTISLKGEVKEFQWTNPHCWVQVAVPGPGGLVEWSIEATSPSGLANAGYNRRSLKAGDKVVIAIHPLRNGNPGGALVSVSINGVMIGKPTETPKG